MELRNNFLVPAAPDDAWDVLLDLERVAGCMPGFSLDSVADDSVSGAMKVKVGPMSMTYRGEARFVETDEGPHRVVLRAEGTEARGSGTAGATITAQLHEAEGATKVTVDTDLAVTGRPAQFGRGVLAEVSQQILDQFAAELSQQLQPDTGASLERNNGDPGRGAPAPDRPGASPPTEAPARRDSGDQLDLAAVIARSLARRAWPVLLAGVSFAAGWVARRALREQEAHQAEPRVRNRRSLR
jgi:uncharacterized protein